MAKKKIANKKIPADKFRIIKISKDVQLYEQDI